MVESSHGRRISSHVLLCIAVAVIAFPIYMTFTASTLTIREIMAAPMPLVPGRHLVGNYLRALTEGARLGGESPIGVDTMYLNSLVVALGITFGKIITALLAAFALVYFRFPGRQVTFWLIFITLMLPVEVRILPTYGVVASLKLLNTYAGLILPLIASATATFLFRQYFRTIPDEIVEAAVMDGCRPMRFFATILIPMSKTMIAAMTVIQFVYGWNQYLWPLLVTTKPRFYTVLLGISRMLAVGDQQAEWHIIMASTILAMLPPMVVIIVMQKQFIQGMTEREK